MFSSNYRRDLVWQLDLQYSYKSVTTVITDLLIPTIYSLLEHKSYSPLHVMSSPAEMSRNQLQASRSNGPNPLYC
jgi:hypothetical protein